MKRLSTLLLGALALTTAAAQTPRDNHPDELPFAMPEVTLPAIPEREATLTGFGGDPSGARLSTEAFAAAIDHLAAQGGGTLRIPAGVWHTGPIVLRSNIRLEVERGAIILFSNDKSLYPLVETSFEGYDNTRRCQSPISARGARNIAITGQGVIDGNGEYWRPLKREKVNESTWRRITARGGCYKRPTYWFPSEQALRGDAVADMNVPRTLTTDEEWAAVKDFLRPVMVSLIDCENILLQGVVFQNSPAWNIHPLLCRNLTVDGVTVRNPSYAQNGDGIDIESCRNVIVRDSRFDVGDDGICIKSGKDKAGRDRGIPCENIIVDDCIVFHGHGGFVVGSEMSGGVKNVMVSNCTFSGTDVGLRFKSTRGRGGVVENIRIENIAMNDIVQDALLFDLFYGGKSASEAVEEGTGEATDMVLRPVDETTPAFRNIHIRNVWCRGARRAMFFNGLPEMNVEHVTVENARIFARTGAEICESTDVLLRDVTVVPERGPALKLNNVKKFRAEEFSCPEGMECALQATGSRNRDILVSSKEITSANACLSAGAAGAVTIDE